MDPIWMGLAGLVVTALVYFAGVDQGKRSERRHWTEHDKRETDRQQEEFVTAKVEQYLVYAGNHFVEGIQALAMLGMYELDSDERIRDAIDRMRMRSGKDPLGSKSRQALEGVDLRHFFRHVGDEEIDLFHTSVAAALALIKDPDA